MLRIRQGCPLGVRGLETGVRNGKDQPASWLENPSYALKGCSKISNSDQRHDTDTAGKLAVVKLLSALSISLNIHNSQWLLLFIASCQPQQVRSHITTPDLRSPPSQLPPHPSLPTSHTT